MKPLNFRYEFQDGIARIKETVKTVVYYEELGHDRLTLWAGIPYNDPHYIQPIFGGGSGLHNHYWIDNGTALQLADLLRLFARKYDFLKDDLPVPVLLDALDHPNRKPTQFGIEFARTKISEDPQLWYYYIKLGGVGLTAGAALTLATALETIVNADMNFYREVEK